MKLSDINPTAIYETTLPSTKKLVKFRPFVVKEERALLSAYESEDANVMLNTLVSVVKSCVQSPVKTYTSFDIEYLFLQIRSKSVGEYSQLIFTCISCDKQTDINIDIREAKVTESTADNVIKISDNITFIMKYPEIDSLVEVATGTNPDAVLKNAIVSCIDKIAYGDDVIKISEEPVSDIVDFLDNKLSGKQFKKLEEFLKSVPAVELVVPWTCPHCKHENSVKLKGIHDFF